MIYVQRDGGRIVGLYRQPQFDGGVEITESDALQDTDPEVVAFGMLSGNAAIDAQIKAIELRELAPRYSREAILVGILKDHMRDYSLNAAVALAELTTVGGPRFNAGFTKLKALDDQIKVLRAQRQ